MDYTTVKQELITAENRRKISCINYSNYKLGKLETNTFEGFYELTELNLSKTQLKNVPETIFEQLLNLKTIDLSHNFISTLEESVFRNNSKLEKINLSHNWLSEINGNIYKNLDLLRKLDFSHNRIDLSEKPNLNSDSLKELNLGYNKIKNLNQLGFYTLPSLIILSLNNNRIPLCNMLQFEFMRKIEYLDLSNNSVEKLDSETFQNLYKLKYVDFSNNLLKSIGKCFLDKPNLIEINLLNNPIEFFATGREFISETLCTLKLSISQALNLHRFINLKCLSDFELHVKANDVFPVNKIFLSWISPLTIQKIHIEIQKGNFQINQLSYQFPNLETLHIEFLELSDSSFTLNIEHLINNMPKLTHLTLKKINKLIIKSEKIIKKNNLTHLDLTGLYNDSIDFLKNNFINLEVINLSLSQVKSITQDLMKTLPNLKKLIMNNAKLCLLDNNLFKYNYKIEEIDLGSCEISEIKENFFGCLGSVRKSDMPGTSH